jgi:hypothetical protein
VYGSLRFDIVAIRKFIVLNEKQPPAAPFKTVAYALVSPCKKQGLPMG